MGPIPGETRMPGDELDRRQKIDRLKRLMEGMRTEVHVVDGGRWVDIFAEIIREKGLGDLLYSPKTDVGIALEKHWKRVGDRGENLPELIPYEENVEDFKRRLFDVAAAITTSRGAIADSGAVVLCPDEKEPRLMSLVPPVHIVVLNGDSIYGDLFDFLEREGGHQSMPTNVVLVSGPSKTADIELTLAFGVHGPKELILFICSSSFCDELK